MNAYFGESIDKRAWQSRQREETYNMEDESMNNCALANANQRRLDTVHVVRLEEMLMGIYGCYSVDHIRKVRAYSRACRAFLGYPPADFDKEATALIAEYLQ